MTVQELIEALKLLPSDAPVLLTWFGGIDELTKGDGTFQVYEISSHRIELHIDDGQAFHADFEGRRIDLWKWREEKKR